jgi:hypothetical protein
VSLSGTCRMCSHVVRPSRAEEGVTVGAPLLGSDSPPFSASDIGRFDNLCAMTTIFAPSAPYAHAHELAS